MAAPVSYSKSSSFMAELKALYVSPPVQRIRFRFGPAQILPADFRYLAFKLGAEESWVTIRVDPTWLKKEKANAAYDPDFNCFIFRNDLVLREPTGRGEAVHEGTHAIFDLRDTVEFDLTWECCCFMSRAWYHIETGTEAAFTHVPELIEIAAAARARGGSMPAEFRLSERLEVRRILRKGYSYERRVTRAADGFEPPYR